MFHSILFLCCVAQVYHKENNCPIESMKLLMWPRIRVYDFLEMRWNFQNNRSLSSSLVSVNRRYSLYFARWHRWRPFEFEFWTQLDNTINYLMRIESYLGTRYLHFQLSRDVPSLTTGRCLTERALDMWCCENMKSKRWYEAGYYLQHWSVLIYDSLRLVKPEIH